MATAVQTLRGNIGDTGSPPAWSDPELTDLLTEADGSEPRARVAALLPLWAEAAGRTDYTVGASSEKASQAFAMLRDMLTQAQAEVAALDAASVATGQATEVSAVAVPVQVYFD